MTARVKCHIWKAQNGEWTYHIKRGARIVLTPGETYATRYSCRRAVKALAGISTDHSEGTFVSALQSACLYELGQEAELWKKR